MAGKVNPSKKYNPISEHLEFLRTLSANIGRLRGAMEANISRFRRRRFDGAEEPQEQQREEQSADGELEPDGGLRRGEEAFQAAGDDQQGNDAGDQARGFDAAAGLRLGHAMLFPGGYRWKDSVAKGGIEATRLVSGIIPLLVVLVRLLM